MVLQRRVDDVDFVDEIAEVVILITAHRYPYESDSSWILVFSPRSSSCSASEAVVANCCPVAGLKQTPALSGGAQAHRGLESDLSARKSEEVVEVGLDGFGPAQEHVEQLHAARPIWASSSVSCCRRRSRVGWVENRVERLMPLANAGGEEEGVEVFRGPQISGRDARHLSCHFHQCLCEQPRLADQDRPGAVGRQFPVARERPDEEEADGVNQGREGKHAELDERQLATSATPAALVPVASATETTEETP